MAANVLIQTQLGEAVKKEAIAVLTSMGLTVADAVRLLLTRVAGEHALPFGSAHPECRNGRGDAGGASGASAIVRQR